MPKKSGKKGSSELPLAPLERMIKKAGAERVSNEAARELAMLLQEKATALSSRAVKLAKHAGRVTVTAEDIKMSSKSL
ncbi:MAG: histone family protein [Candidatus Micrarchaeota archaeon]|nr:histone family protein [Candidatus Micrarchaeota archaeon]